MYKQITVCVPSFDSLDYLKILYKSFKKNTKIAMDFIVHSNAHTSEMDVFLKENEIQFTSSPKNLGFTGVNKALKLVKTDYVFIVNTDMYFLPNWDLALLKEIKGFEKKGVDKFTLSADLIEPAGNNPEYVIEYFGHDTCSFQEDNLLNFYYNNKSRLNTGDKTQYSHPILVPMKYMKVIGYLDDNYFPGWSVDHDLPAALYIMGFRHFKKVCSCRVYHFISKTFTKLSKKDNMKHGQDVFLNKWGITVDEFRKKLGIANPYREVPGGIL